jgi:uncharacterized membrane protein
MGLLWLVIGIATTVIGRRNARRSTREGAGGAAIIGICVIGVAVLTLFATLLLAVVPGND